jgi:hypothetical protein
MLPSCALYRIVYRDGDVADGACELLCGLVGVGRRRDDELPPVNAVSYKPFSLV